MANYFNRTRGPVTVSLRNGDSACIGPKHTLSVTPEQDGSASLHAMVRRKLIVRLKEKTPKPVPAPAPKPVPTPAPVPAASPEDDQSEVPSQEWTRAKLKGRAESVGLEVPSSWTKVEILEAIEGAG